MRVRSTGFAAVIAAAGIVVCLSGPEPALAARADTQAAAADQPIVLAKFKKHRASAARKTKTAQVRHARKVAAKASSSRKPSRAIAQKVDEKDDAADSVKSELPSSVANAHAEALAADEARNIAALDNPNVTTVNGVKIAASDQLTDADRALSEKGNVAEQEPTAAAQETPESAPQAAASAAPSPPSPDKIVRAMPSGEQQAVKATDSDTWGKTSLIGKIFVAFGSLLTLASAARLLIA